MRPRILTTAYACRPGLGSEDGSGWALAGQLRNLGDVWVITPSHNRPAIEAAQARGEHDDITFTYVDVPGVGAASPLADRFRRTHYNAWQARIVGPARRLHRQVDFGVVHHRTYAQYWSGSWMTELGVPFVWGPVGGGERAPDSFVASLDEDGRRYERNRDFARRVGERYPVVRRCAREAAAVLASTQQTREALEALGARDVVVMPSAALPDRDFARLAALPADRAGTSFRAVCAGRLEHWKGFHLGVEAMAGLLRHRPDATLDILGDGPARGFLQATAVRAGVTEAVRFHGAVRRDIVLDHLAEAHVLLHPSFHDSAGWVTMEAMAAAVPVVCLALGGPGEQVTAETGFAVAANTPAQAVADMADALVLLADDERQRLSLGLNGRRRIATHYTWSRLIERIFAVGPYASLHDTARHGSRVALVG